ncbi:MAG: type III polyketide synthase [bacterium]|nr:type III polyketide synthase [bacterium]
MEVLAIGTALPEYTLSPDETAEMSQRLVCRNEREARLMRAMLRHSRVTNRHTCVPHQLAYQWLDEEGGASSNPGPTTRERMEWYAAHAGPLAAISSAQALDRAGISAAEISHLVTVSCTGFDAPGVDIHLIQKLGLQPTTQRVHVGYMGCHGALNGLRVASAFAGSQPEARVLLAATELCSLHFRFQWQDESILANALFADGSAALVGGSTVGTGNFRVVASGSCLVPDSQDAMTWSVGNHGFEMTLSSRVPVLIGEYLVPWLESWLHQHDLRLSQVGSWAVHPGGPKILSAVESALELDDDALLHSRAVLQQLGNMSSPTLLFILQRMLDADVPRPIVALGFGPGLMVEAALIK